MKTSQFKNLGIALATALVIPLITSHGTAVPSVWYVDVAVESSGDGLTWETAFKTIQEGIDAADSGGTVLVAEGTYVENIHFDGKNIILTSTDPFDPSVVTGTIIDGNQAGSVVTFDGTEEETCVLSGFTIQGGFADEGAGICGGGLYLHNTALIAHNIIRDNRAFRHGGGVAFCDGNIRDNTVSGNSAGTGGGLYWCDGMIEGNTITGNTAAGSGGGVCGCGGTIRNNVVARNSAGRNGGGLAVCSGSIINNTIFANSIPSSYLGSGLYRCEGLIRNCIIWGNSGWYHLFECSVPTYSCIEGSRGGGEGNIRWFPHFVDAAGGDFHLRSWSPCIDAGDPATPFSEEPEPSGGRADMGAYGGTAQATPRSVDSDRDGLPDDWEIEFFGTVAPKGSDDPDGDLVPNILEYRGGFCPTEAPTWHVDGAAPPSGDGKSWETAFKSIQEGVDAAREGDTVIVAEGCYAERIFFGERKLNAGAKNIILRSTNPFDRRVVSNTILERSEEWGPSIWLSGLEGEYCLIAGLRIENGYGINGGYTDCRTYATILNNIISNNSGDAIYCCDGLIEGNLIVGSQGFKSGAGLSYCSGTVRNNVIFRNFYAGFFHCNGIILNNTIVENSGPGLFWCGKVQNCILWGNSVQIEPAVGGYQELSHSCIQDWTGRGDGNISEEPRFVDAENGDFRLRADSPCIDAGLNSPDLPEFDIVGMHRIMFGGKSLTVDMGAYEFYVNKLEPVPGTNEAVFTWSSLADKTYSIFYTDDLFNWHIAIADFPSSGDTTTSWLDDGTLTGAPPLLAPQRFYRILENP